MEHIAQSKKRTDSGQDLYSLISDANCHIDALNVRDDCIPFATQLRRNNQDMFSAFSEESAVSVSQRIAACQLGAIKEIPTIVQSMLGGIDLRTTEPAVKCALVGALAYLVKPRDLLHDNLPGGYGFVDDCMILRATVSEFKKILPPGFTSDERENRLLKLLGMCIPDNLEDALMGEIDGLWLTFHSLLWASEDDVDDLTENIIRDPLGVFIPTSEPDSIPLPSNSRFKLESNFTIKVEDNLISIVMSDNTALVIGADDRLIE